MRSIRNCSVCVVGGAGFLGSHCVDHLLEDRGCQVLVIDNLCAGRREFVHPSAQFFHADITSSEHCLATVFLQHQVEYVFQYAAYPYVPDSFARPLRVCDVNFMGAIQCLNAAQEAGCKGILQVSSAEIYGDAGTWAAKADGTGDVIVRKIRETDEVRPHSSYGVSKMAVDAFVQTAWRERRTPCIALRQFNCCGTRDILHPYVLVTIIEQLLDIVHRFPAVVVPTVYLGNNTSRDFLDAGDAVRMAVELLESGEFGGIYNSGSERTIKMYDLARLVGKVMGFAEMTVEPDPARVRPWDIEHLQSDNTKLYSTIEYRPRVPLEESIRRMVEWYKENVK